MSTRTIEPTKHRHTSTRTNGPGGARSLRTVPVEVASPWAGRQSPCTATEELAFVEELEVLSGDHDVDEFERRDVTVLITALRCGLTPDELFAQAPGVKPYRLLAAHRELEGRRLISEHAWRTISVDPSPLTFETFAPCAAELLPAVMSQLAPCMGDQERLRAAVEDATDQVNRTTRRVRMLEQRLADTTGGPEGDPDKARELGTLLYDVYGQGAWSLPTFLPPRVGSLVPLRLGALLGDDITANRRAS
jgi:hypothetical protein